MLNYASWNHYAFPATACLLCQKHMQHIVVSLVQYGLIELACSLMPKEGSLRTRFGSLSYQLLLYYSEMDEGRCLGNFFFAAQLAGASPRCPCRDFAAGPSRFNIP